MTANNSDVIFPGRGGRILFRVVRVDTDRASIKARDGFEFDVPRVLPIFLPSFPGESVELRSDVTISAEFVPGTYDQITAVLIEDDMVFERKDFEGTQSEQAGWCPYNNPAPPAGKP